MCEKQTADEYAKTQVSYAVALQGIDALSLRSFAPVAARIAVHLSVHFVRRAAMICPNLEFLSVFPHCYIPRRALYMFWHHVERKQAKEAATNLPRLHHASILCSGLHVQMLISFRTQIRINTRREISAVRET